MTKKLFLPVVLLVLCPTLTFAIDGWIRINLLGYLPGAQKNAIFISESPVTIKEFAIYDALSNQPLRTFNTVTDKGAYLNFKNTYILDFSSFNLQGAFYIKAGIYYSPIIYINKNIWLGTADCLISFLRKQRFRTTGALTIYNPNAGSTTVKPLQPETYLPTGNTYGTIRAQRPARIKPEQVRPIALPPATITANGGWMDPENGNQYSAITAQTVYELLMAYQLCPLSFADNYNKTGKAVADHTPDILNEARWGLNWLLDTFRADDSLFYQYAPVSASAERQELYMAPVSCNSGTDKQTPSGLASLAGKYSAAFALGAELFSKYDQAFADTLKHYALQAYALGQKHPGTLNTYHQRAASQMHEEDWADDMETAAAHLYRLSFDANDINAAAAYGRMQPVSPWMCSDTAQHYQWYPYFNAGHYQLANVENPRYKKEFTQNLLTGIQRMKISASNSPFGVGVPMIRNSNNMAVALATQCRLYRTLTADSTYIQMENDLVDWIFGRNIWGTSMVSGIPGYAASAQNYFNESGTKRTKGALVNGPVYKSTYMAANNSAPEAKILSEHSENNPLIYKNDGSDFETNLPTIDGTASLAYLLASLQQDGVPGKTSDLNTYDQGGIVRTDDSQKTISLAFMGNAYADGYKIIRSTLKNQHIKASFFFTGNFFRNRSFSGIIKDLIKDGHYIGGNSDKNMVYCSWHKRDSLIVTKDAFLTDLRNNYEAMQKFDIGKQQAPFFMAPYDYYNDSISAWCREAGLHIVSATPGVLSCTDTSIPEMREGYFSTNEIYNKIMAVEKKYGMNGYILVYNIGTDKRRQDKFYPRLITLIMDLKKKGYRFTDLYEATGAADPYNAENNATGHKQKRKN